MDLLWGAHHGTPVHVIFARVEHRVALEPFAAESEHDERGRFEPCRQFSVPTLASAAGGRCSIRLRRSEQTGAYWEGKGKWDAKMLVRAL
jgi:hypothetical protein